MKEVKLKFFDSKKLRNLSPKKKAQHLFETFKAIYTSPYAKTNSEIKELALFCVDEITNALVGCHTAEQYGNYWMKVKTEIRKYEPERAS